MTSEIESQISRVINKLENAKKDLNFFPTTNETQEGNYRMQKKIAGVVSQVNVNVSSFDAQDELNPNNKSINEITNSFSEQPSDLIEQSFPKPTLRRRAGIILDLNKLINIGEYKIELGKLLNILDKKLPENKENNQNNDISKTYTQCTTEENERRKSFVSPEKKKEKNSDSEKKENSLSSQKESEKEPNYKNNRNDFEEFKKDTKFDENLAKKYHKISLLLKAYINENKLVNELNKKSQKENIINNYNVNFNDTNNMNINCRRKSLFDMTSYIIPSESSIKSFSKNNQLPHLISNFFKHKKEGKKKKRNSYVDGQLCNKLKKLNQQLQLKNTSKKISQSEKAEFKIKPSKSSKTDNSNIPLNKKKYISNFKF